MHEGRRDTRRRRHNAAPLHITKYETESCHR
ncbi:Uncharacterised protein [Vibrio cholerae]|nr:Uncharacterised protein [Vibrio cholerae]